ncbi:MAG TPA: hypothetical protein VN898_14665, partial [Candidatus Binatia bacterium]|nr:hypothetical protein [Candidatus Binatia bacterium]
YYCRFTPIDTGTAPPAPRGVHETMCFPSGAWSFCGSTNGTTPATTNRCAGPGVVDPSGLGVWVQTKFNLAGFLGQRIRVRWIGTTWMFDSTAESYYQIGGGWASTDQDDGWWLDNIQVTGVLTGQRSLLPDVDPGPPTSCPAPADNCDENAPASDRGTSPALKITNLAGNPIDGSAFVETTGAPIRVSAIDSALTGGCTGGVAQFRFTKNGLLVQDWSAKTSYQDAPTADATYAVQVRCSSDPSCTSVTGAVAGVQVYAGDGSDIVLAVSHDLGSGVTTIGWPSRPQPAPLAGYDLFRGVQADDGSGISPMVPDVTLATLAPLSCNVAQALPVGTNVTVTTTASPAAGSAHYYLAGHNHPATGARTPLGLRSDGTVRLAPIGCP